MKAAEKKKVNKAVGVVVDPTYFNEIPLADIMEAIEGLGYLVVDEEHNRWSGFLCGRVGQALFDILSKETGRLDNSNLRLSWYTMASGDTRFWLMWPETLNRGQELRFLSLLERFWLKSEIRRQTMEADTTQFQASNGNQPRGFGRWGFQIGNEEHFFVGLYSRSKKEAFKIAQTRSEERVVVLPDKKLAPQGLHP